MEFVAEGGGEVLTGQLDDVCAEWRFSHCHGGSDGQGVGLAVKTYVEMCGSRACGDGHGSGVGDHHGSHGERVW